MYIICKLIYNQTNCWYCSACLTLTWPWPFFTEKTITIFYFLIRITFCTMHLLVCILARNSYLKMVTSNCMICILYGFFFLYAPIKKGVEISFYFLYNRSSKCTSIDTSAHSYGSVDVRSLTVQYKTGGHRTRRRELLIPVVTLRCIRSEGTRIWTVSLPRRRASNRRFRLGKKNKIK